MVYFFISLIVPLLIDFFIHAKGKKNNYGICLKDPENEEIIKSFIFNREDVNAYYDLLEGIYNEKLDLLIKNEKKEGEVKGSYYLLIRLFDKALIDIKNV